MSAGTLLKLKIVQYSDAKFKEPSGPEMDVPLNPSKYSQKLTVKYSGEQEQGTQGNNPSFSKAPPEEMQFEFVFDGTGVVPGGRNVEEDIKKFRELAYKVDGKIHRPNFLKLIWGPLSFNGVLQSLNIDYTLFKPNGVALRAKLNTTFICVKDEERREVEQGYNSPDLTHIRYSKEGDTLPLMTYEIYKNAALYPHVALYNGLTSLRTLKPNTKIVFPPIDRTLP